MSTGAIIRGKGPLGGFPDHIVKSLKRANTGRLTGVCERHFKVGPSGFRINLDWLNQAFAPDPGWGIPCVDCDATPGNGIVVVKYNYEGIDDNYTFGVDAISYELDSSMEDEPIETHPAIKLLIANYGYDPDNKQFPQYIAATGNGGAALSGGQQKQKANPLFGTESWRTVGVIFRVTYCVKVVPQSAYRAWGTLISRPDGLDRINMPDQPTRPWLRLNAKISRKGNACNVSEEAMLGKPGGIPAARIIYSSAQLDGVTGGSSSGSGLTSGGL
jgi:hypothetical protein